MIISNLSCLIGFNEEKKVDLLVALTNQESIKLEDYRKYAFFSYGNIEVEDLTSSYHDDIIRGDYTKTDVFNRIFCLSGSFTNSELGTFIEFLKNKEEIENVSFCSTNYLLNAGIGNQPNEDNQWLFDMIHLENAWQTSIGNSNIKVGIVDTGIDINNPYIANKVDTNLSKSFVDSAESALDDFTNHGTKVAGIIGTQYGTNKIISGICKNVTLVSLKIYASDNHGTELSTARAIDYANKNDIDLLNVSIGSTKYSYILEQTIQNYEGLIICSAGNDNVDIDVNKYYLGGYNCDNLICVGCSNLQDQKASDSNYGMESVDVFAPGNSIYTTSSTYGNSNAVTKASMTSMATPIVTGIAVLLKAQFPTLTTSQLKYRILSNSLKINSLTNFCKYGARVDAEKIVSNNNHNHTNYSVYNLYQHKVTCSCGINVYENHKWIENSGSILKNNTYAIVNGYICELCGQTSVLIP